MKYAIISIMLLLSFKGGHAQETSNWSALFAAQKSYVSNVIAPEHRAAYLTQIHMAYIAHAKVWPEIKKMFPAVSVNGSWNMLEKISPGGELTGVIWAGGPGDAYYQFRYSSDQKLTVSQHTLAQLSDTAATIVSNFQNWSGVTFEHQGEVLGAPRERSFFLASRVSGDIPQIICFYYP